MSLPDVQRYSALVKELPIEEASQSLLLFCIEKRAGMCTQHFTTVLQDYRNFHLYGGHILWKCMSEDDTPESKRTAICARVAALGGRCLSETSVRWLLAIWLHATFGCQRALALPVDESLRHLAAMKGEIKRLSTLHVETPLALPVSPADFEISYPLLSKRAFADGDGPCKPPDFFGRMAHN